tara:strand:- start:22977 stop:24755 length:1779 start_codon:yes stop_codon:yes gene_type:complete
MSYDHTIKKSTTSKIIELMIRDSSTGAGKTSVAHTDVTASYVRESGTRTAISLASGSAGDSYSSGKWAEVDSTNTPGLYQLHIPDAALATGANAVTIFLKASSVIDKVIRISLIDADLRNSTTLGLTNLDAAISTRSTFDHSSNDVTVGTNNDKSGYSITGTVTTANASDVTAIKAVTDNLPNSGALSDLATAANLATVDTVVDAIKVKTDQFVFTVANQVDANALTGGGSGLDAAGVRSAIGLSSANLDTQLGDIPTVSEFEARTLVASAYFDASADQVTTDSASREASKANVSALATSADLATVDSNVDAIKAKTDQFVFTVSNQVDANTLTGGVSASSIRAAIGLSSANLDTQLADLPTVSEFEARTLLASAYFDPVNDVVANVTLVGTTTTNTDMRGTDGANTTTPNTVAPDNSSITAIKAKTDELTFTVSNQVDANALTMSGGGDATLSNQTSIIGMLTGASVVVSQSDLKVGDSVTLRQGMDYHNVDGTAISWTGSSSNQWPDLTGATVTFTAKQGDKTITQTATVSSPTGTQSFYVEFTAAELSATNAPTGSYRYFITALLSNGRKTTLITDSTLRVAEPYSSGE